LHRAAVFFIVLQHWQLCFVPQHCQLHFSLCCGIAHFATALHIDHIFLHAAALATAFCITLMHFSSCCSICDCVLCCGIANCICLCAVAFFFPPGHFALCHCHCLMLGKFLWQCFVQKKEKNWWQWWLFSLPFFDATPSMGAGNIVLGKKSTCSASCCVFVHEKNNQPVALVAVLLWWWLNTSSSIGNLCLAALPSMLAD